MRNQSMPVYPTGDHNGSEPSAGLTKREWFVAHAMQGLLAAHPSPQDLSSIVLAEAAVGYADAVLAKLEAK